MTGTGVWPGSCAVRVLKTDLFCMQSSQAVRITRDVNFPGSSRTTAKRASDDATRTGLRPTRADDGGLVRRVPSELGPPNGHGDRSEGNTLEGRIL